MLEGASVLVIIFLVVVVFYLLRAIRMVPQGFNYTVERFGRYVRTLEPGPGAHRPLHRSDRPQDEYDGTLLRRSEPGGHHPRQRYGEGRRDRLLPGPRCAQGRL